MTTALKPANIERPVTIREQVLNLLKEQILTGQLKTNARLVEVQIAGQLGVSRTPVREALHVLERDGLIEVVPGGGHRVRGLSWREVEEICDIRVVNETLAAQWALEKITPLQLAQLKQNIDLTEKDIHSGKIANFSERDGEFHEILARSCGSERLLELCQMLRRHMLRYRLKAVYEASSGLTAVEGHKRIYRCLAEKDREGLNAEVRRHIEETKEDIRIHVFKDKIPGAKDAGN